MECHCDCGWGLLGGVGVIAIGCGVITVVSGIGCGIGIVIGGVGLSFGKWP